MSIVNELPLSLTITGNVTPEEIADALRRYFTGRKVFVDRDGTKKLDPNSEDLLIAPAQSSETIEDLKNLLEWKEREMKEMEASSAKALNSIQTFHQQQQALFDEFVLLRQRYDEQKLALLNILWIHCGQYHPDLRQIPVVKDVNTYIENDDRVGEYTIGEMLGEGQFAMVKSCWKDGGEEYAIKIIKKERITTFTSLKRVSNEIEILRKLRSEFIVSVKDVIQTITKLYIITEKGGADLFEFFDEHPDGVPEPWAKDIITCVLKAVLYCHDQGICHRGTDRNQGIV
jgi:hypothetical protein